MPKRIAVFGGSFNPPHLAHLGAVRTLAASGLFDEVKVVPCGPRPDKPTTNDIEPIHRAAMTDMTFGGIDKVTVDLFDLENGCFTRTRQLEERYGAEGEVWHVVGTDLIAGGARRESSIHRVWEHPDRTWQELRFAVLERPGSLCDDADFPPRHVRIRSSFVGASSDIRDSVFRGRDIADQVVPRVAAYIGRYNLYRGVAPPRKTALAFREPRCYLDVDAGNALAVALARRFAPYATDDVANADCIVPIGGDGTMLRSINRHARRRLPFVGINAGHKGYLLNEPETIDDPDSFFARLVAHHLSQLSVVVTDPDGKEIATSAFNDAWIERSSLQSAWFSVRVNGRLRIPKVVADGALVATPQGSTAYARAMGAKPLEIGSGTCVVVGSNVSFPADLRLAVQHPLDSVIEYELLDPAKRPVLAVVDGMAVSPAARMRVTASKSVSVEIAFSQGQDLTEKSADDAYPKS